jgi:hypothetical protein
MKPPTDHPTKEELETQLRNLRHELANALMVVDVSLLYPTTWERQRTRLTLLKPNLTRIVASVAKLAAVLLP